MLPPPRRLAGPLALAGALGALFSAGAARAQVTIVPTVTPNGALFNYSYSVTNSTANDVIVVNLNNLPMVSGALTNLTAPMGFQTTFDPGVGIASFLPALGSTQDFMPGSITSGFSFSSAFGPGTVGFGAEDITGGMLTGTTLAPAVPAAPAVPEPSTLISLGAGVLLLTFCVVRRRRAARPGVQS